MIRLMNRTSGQFNVIRMGRPCPSPEHLGGISTYPGVADSIEKSAGPKGTALVHTAHHHVQLPIPEGYLKRTFFPALLLVIPDMDDFLLFT
jgi:hypothetical protein